MYSGPVSYYYRVGENTPPVIQRVLESKGWRQYPPDANEGEDHPVAHWNFCWKVGRYRPSEIQECQPWQRLNHFPRSQAITHKDTLLRNLRNARSAFGRIYDFFPMTFVLPTEFVKFATHYSQQKTQNIWICKPADLSRGRKIFLIQNIHELSYDCPSVVQRYIERPLLIGRYKFDLRIYVLVTSFHPLTVYMYKEGLARFATEKYNVDHFGAESWKFAHLTNSSVNKYGPRYQVNKDYIGAGSKWTLSRLNEHFDYNGINKDKIWIRIKNILTLTLLTIVGVVPPAPGCFELFGFDVIIDEKLKPWLLEVNFSPALAIDCHIDEIVKEPLISDLVDLLDIPPFVAPPVEHERRRMMRPVSAGSSGSTALFNIVTNTRSQREGESIPSFRPLPSNFASSNTERLGNFQKIFPFNEVTYQISKRIGLRGEKEGDMRIVVNEIRSLEA